MQKKIWEILTLGPGRGNLIKGKILQTNKQKTLMEISTYLSSRCDTSMNKQELLCAFFSLADCFAELYVFGSLLNGELQLGIS